MRILHAVSGAAFPACAAALCLLAAGPASGEETGILRPEEVRAGMTGYGLTVFRGRQPERFSIEVLGRLNKPLPKQDIILIRLTDEKVRQCGVVAGMSGSPVYVTGDDGKALLIGALAYAWSFQVEAVAGVTPITNMLGDLDTYRREGPQSVAADAMPALSAAAQAGGRQDECRPAMTSAGYASAPADRQPNGRPDAVASEPEEEIPAPGALRPLRAPLVISGMSQRLFGRIRRDLLPYGFEPVQGGAGGADEGADGAAAGEPRFAPGDAIGVQLMRGDSDWTSIGTVTHVAGRHVLAYGHPFMLGGRWEAPITTADVQWILASEYRSFKLANAGIAIGRLVDDRQACIIGEIGPAVEMVPCEIRVSGGAQPVAFRYEMIQHHKLTSVLAFYALADSIDAAFPHADNATLTVRQRIGVAGRRAVEVETVEAVVGSFSFSMLAPLSAILRNPFERVRIERMDFDVAVEPGCRTAGIMSVQTDAQEVRPGSKVRLTVRLRPYGGEDENVEMLVDIPEEQPAGSLSISVSAASQVRPDLPPPRDLDDFLTLVEAGYPSTSLAAVIGRPTKGLRYEGRVMPALPASAVNVLAPAGVTGPGPSQDQRHQLMDTRWVLSGSAGVTLRVVERK